MPANNNKKKRPTAAEASKPKRSAKKKPAGKGEPDASVGHSRLEKDARARGNKPAKSSLGSGPACEKCGEVHRRCSAHNRFGKQCMQMPLRYQQVCRSHGGATKLSRAAAQERMMMLVYPALARLEELVTDPDTDPAIVVKVVSQIFDRAHGAGLGRNATVEIGLGDSVFDKLLTNGVFEFDREELELDTPAARPALSGGDAPTDDELDALIEERERRRARDASTKLDNTGHDVVTAEVVEDPHPTKGAERGGYRGRTTRTGPVEFPTTDPRNAGATEYDPQPAGRRRGTQRDLYEDPEDA